MTTPRVTPELLILDDEKAQLAALRAQLSPLGNVRQFDDPTKALAYLQNNPVDVAVVDIRMPQFPTDGMDFIEQLRQLDENLAVVIRTADEGASVADRALENRVFRRLVKSRTTFDEVHRVIKEAVEETRTKRQRARAADEGTLAKTELVRARGAIDEHISISRMYRSLLHSQRNQMTAVTALAEGILAHATAHRDLELKNFGLGLQQMASRPEAAGVATDLRSLAGQMVTMAANRTDAELLNLAKQNHQTTAKVVRHTVEFLSSPLFLQEGQRQISVNKTLEALIRLLEGNSNVQAATSTVVTPLATDMRVTTAPQKLITGLRHIVEFCYLRRREQSKVQVLATYVENPRTEITLLNERSLVFNRNFAPHSPAIKLTVCTQMNGINLAELHEEFVNPGSDPQRAALPVYGLTMTDAGHMFVVSELPNQFLVFDSYLSPSA